VTFLQKTKPYDSLANKIASRRIGSGRYPNHNRQYSYDYEVWRTIKNACSCWTVWKHNTQWVQAQY